ncbi:hypothetical protein yfred0001_29260 [Yersinia frederiksenii ATCC 33641]|nr:hypothetical protein yfred0001_29260 [Yersinia frederiksenii ATCC 33641]
MVALSDNNLIGSHCALLSRWFLLLIFALATAGLPWAQLEIVQNTISGNDSKV